MGAKAIETALFSMPSPTDAGWQILVGLAGAAAFGLGAIVLSALATRGAHRAVISSTHGLRKLDGWLALRVANWLGLDQSNWLRRWSRLVLILGGCASALAFGPGVIAWPCLGAAIVALVSVFRRWSWDEEDRAADRRGDAKRTPGNEDYNDELLFALSAVFLFGVLSIWRLSGAHVFESSPGAGLIANLIYVASEALEALPIVGNVEVLGYDNPSGVSAVLPTGGWFAFALRMALDIIVIGGVLKVMEIGARIARGDDLRRLDAGLEGRDPAAFDAALIGLERLVLEGSVQAADRLQVFALSPGDGSDGAAARRYRVADRLFVLGLRGAPGAFGMLGAATAAMRDLHRRKPGAQVDVGVLERRRGHALTHFAYRNPAQADQLLAEAEEAFALSLRHLAKPRDLAAWGGLIFEMLQARRMRVERTRDKRRDARLRRMLRWQRFLLKVMQAHNLSTVASHAQREISVLLGEVGRLGSREVVTQSIMESAAAAEASLEALGERFGDQDYEQALSVWASKQLQLATLSSPEEARGLREHVLQRQELALARLTAPSQRASWMLAAFYVASASLALAQADPTDVARTVRAVELFDRLSTMQDGGSAVDPGLVLWRLSQARGLREAQEIAQWIAVSPDGELNDEQLLLLYQQMERRRSLVQTAIERMGAELQQEIAFARFELARIDLTHHANSGHRPETLQAIHEMKVRIDGLRRLRFNEALIEPAVAFVDQIETALRDAENEEGEA